MIADILSRRYVLLTSFGVKLLGFDYAKDMYANDPDFSNIYESCDKGAIVDSLDTMDIYFGKISYVFINVQ